RSQVILTLLVGAIGFGGMFAVYTYITTTLTDVAGMPLGYVPIVLALFGMGMIAGNIIGGVLADRGVDLAVYAAMISMVIVLAAFVAAAHNPFTAAIGAFLVGGTGAALAPGLQTRLMDVAHDAQTLAAALNHAALNIANAAGAWLGGIVIAAGLGYTAPALVGVVLGIGGVLLFSVTVSLARRDRAHAQLDETSERLVVEAAEAVIVPRRTSRAALSSGTARLFNRCITSQRR
ncbi:MFS transporter, partial [Nocardia gipuzkoensis]